MNSGFTGTDEFSNNRNESCAFVPRELTLRLQPRVCVKRCKCVSILRSTRQEKRKAKGDHVKGVDTERSAVQRSVGVAECHSYWWQEAAPKAPGLHLVVVMARVGCGCAERFMRYSRCLMGGLIGAL